MARKFPILCLLSIPLALTEVAVTTLGAQQPPELIIRNGLVVTAAGRSTAGSGQLAPRQHWQRPM